MLADLLVTSSLCISLAQAHGAAGQGSRAALSRALRGTLSNPLPWSIAAGALFSVAGIQLAGPPEVVVRMLGDAAHEWFMRLCAVALNMKLLIYCVRCCRPRGTLLN